MSKNFDNSKLIAGLKPEFRKDRQPENIDKIVSRIHETAADEKEKNILGTKRTTIDLPKELHKRISQRVLDKDLTMKDYFIQLAEKDLAIK